MRRAARYRDIANHVKAGNGYTVKTCWIADIMEQNGLKVRRAPNRIDSQHRENPCPIEKREAITEALRHFGVI